MNRVLITRLSLYLFVCALTFNNLACSNTVSTNTIAPTVSTKTIAPSTLQSVSDSAKPGDTIYVTAGESVLNAELDFNTSGTPDNWITYKAIGSVTILPGLTNQVRINGDYIILDGFHITQAYSFKILGQNIIFQNGQVDHNLYDGIEIVNTNSVAVLNSDISWSGYDLNGNPYPAITSPKQDHGIYLSNYSPGCTGVSNITISGCYIHDIGGRGIQMNGENCPSSSITNNLIENNVFSRTSWGMVFWGYANSNTVRNNKMTTTGYPTTNDTDHPCIGFYLSNQNQIISNQCVSEFQGSLAGGIGQDYNGANSNSFSGNTYNN